MGLCCAVPEDKPLLRTALFCSHECKLLPLENNPKATFIRKWIGEKRYMENRLELGEVAGRLHTGRTCLPQHINKDWICPLAAGCPNCNRMKPSRCLQESLRASIAEMVLPCGCSSVSCFSHLFTAEGTAPWQWRNTQEEKNRLQPRAGRTFLRLLHEPSL